MDSLLEALKKKALQGIKGVADTYQKVSPYVPFVPHITTPQQIQQNYNTQIKPVVNGINYADTQSQKKGYANFADAAFAQSKTVPKLFTKWGEQYGGTVGKIAMKPLETATSYAANRPLAYGGEAVRNFYGAGSDVLKGKYGSAAFKAGVGTLQGIGSAISLQPFSGVNLAFGGIDTLKGAIYSKRKGENPLSGAEKGFTGERVLGAGDALTDNKNLASALNIGEMVAPLLHGGYSAIKGRLDLRGKGIAVYKDDVQSVKEAIDYLSSEGQKTKPQMHVLQQLEKDAEVYKDKLKLVDNFEGGRDAKTWSRMSLEDKYKMIANKLEDTFYTPRNQGGSGMKMSLVGDKPPLRTSVPKGSYTNDPMIDNPLLAKKGTPQTPGQVMSSSDDYIKELVGRQKQAKGGSSPTSIVQKGKTFLSEIKEKIVDSNAPIEDALSIAEKKFQFKVLPKDDIRLQIDKVLRSKSMASQFAQDNGMTEVIQKAPDLDYLNQYMIAKQATDVSARGVETGRNLEKDRQLVKDLGAVYEPFAQKVNDYSRKLLQYSVDTGLVKKEMADELIKKYPNYVPINRVFSELEQGTMPRVGTRSVASISKQSVVQKLKGSEREISNPIESLLLKTQDAFNQGERNKAASMLAKYRTLPGMKDLIRELPEGSRSNNTFSYLENGVKKTFETTPEIATAAKSLNQEQMGLLAKVVSIPTRILQVGATGLNLPFVVTNVVKDQMTGFINSNKAAKTSLMNPLNFLKSVTSAIEHNDLYDEMVRNAGGGTSFDIARQAPELSVARIRAGRNIGSQIKYTVTHPGELLRAVEDIIGRGEEVSRIQNYKGTKDALLKSGRTAQDATLLGAQAARENTANFARKGSWGKALNWMIPFFNAGIQGARQLDRSFQNNPKGTASKLAVGLFMPVTVATIWNMSDPTRKQAYDDIQDYEKENNMIIIPPNPTKDEKGRWNIIKIPIPPGLSNLTSLVRRPLEQTYGGNAVKLQEIAANLFTAGTSIDVTNPGKLANSVIPQIAKPVIETTTNTNLFTGNKIIPESMKNLPPEMQVKDTTAPGAKAIGNAFGVSPLYIENAAQTIGGGLGSQLIGKENAVGNLERRFMKASGGVEDNKIYEAEQEALGHNAVKKRVLQAYFSGDMESAKKIATENKINLTQKDAKEYKKSLASDVLDMYIDGNMEKAKEQAIKYKLSLTQSDLKKRAKSRAISLYKKAKQLNNQVLMAEAERIAKKYGLILTRKDVE